MSAKRRLLLVRLAGVEPATLGLEVLLTISRKALRSQMFRLSSTMRRERGKVRSSAPSGESLVTVCVAMCAVPIGWLVADLVALPMSGADHRDVDACLRELNLSGHPVLGRGPAAQLHGKRLGTDVQRVLLDRLGDLAVSIH